MSIELSKKGESLSKRIETFTVGVNKRTNLCELDNKFLHLGLDILSLDNKEETKYLFGYLAMVITVPRMSEVYEYSKTCFNFMLTDPTGRKLFHN